jgi:hypothetical protein
MEVTVKCPGCASALPVEAAEVIEAIRCARCRREIGLHVTEAVGSDRAVDACPLCRGADFYTRKDFDPKMGLAVIVAGALVSAVFYWYGRDLVAYGILAAAVLVDLIVATQLKDVTVCYRCHAEFRGRYPRTAPAFDLHTADVLELQYRRDRERDTNTGTI